jgi:hypothetical protein
MSQIARNLTYALGELLDCMRQLIQDRDPLFTAESCLLLAQAGTKS